MKSETQVSRKKQWILRVFKLFVRYRINLEIGGIMPLIYVYLAIFNVHPERF